MFQKYKMLRDQGDEIVGVLVAVLGVPALLSLPAAYIMHVVWWIGLMSAGRMEFWEGVLAIIGVVAPPIGIIHGFVLWFS